MLRKKNELGKMQSVSSLLRERPDAAEQKKIRSKMPTDILIQTAVIIPTMQEICRPFWETEDMLCRFSLPEGSV